MAGNDAMFQTLANDAEAAYKNAFRSGIGESYRPMQVGPYPLTALTDIGLVQDAYIAAPNLAASRLPCRFVFFVMHRVCGV